MRMRIAIGCILVSSSAWAAPVDNLHRLLEGVNSFTANFQQMILDAAGTRLQESQGRFALKRPGMFRWQTEEPFPQLLVSDGQTLWLYDQDLEQVTRKPLDLRLSNTPVLLLTGDVATLNNSFIIEGPDSGDTGLYKLIPRDEQAQFTVMRILFDQKVPQEMQLEDSLGQRTSLVFRDWTLNAALMDTDFSFTPPSGVDLIAE